MVNKNLTLKEYKRFMSKITITDECWNWVGPKDKDGYGSFFLRRALRRAHRVSWYAFKGILGAKVIHHKCRNRACVNPQHLQLITEKENAALRSPYCKKGHLFDRKYGKQRYCSICQSEKTKRLRVKWKANPQLVGV